MGKTGIFTHSQFSTKSILIFDVTLTQMTIDKCICSFDYYKFFIKLISLKFFFGRKS